MSVRTSARNRAAPLLLALAAAVPGCAWANRDNRPVWNAFEGRVVPEDDFWFAVLLPVTVPAGFVAIFLDTFVAHPVQVVDDAWGDARELWRGLEWREHYYTEFAALPLRAIGTPLAFTCSFLARSVFDVPPYEPPLTDAERQAREAAAAKRSAGDWSAWFGSLAAGEVRPPPEAATPPWSAALEHVFQEARRRAPSTNRAALYAAARHASLPPLLAEPWLGLDDADPVVRYQVLLALPADVDVPAALKRALREDSSETVRRLAERRWP